VESREARFAGPPCLNMREIYYTMPIV